MTLPRRARWSWTAAALALGLAACEQGNEGYLLSYLDGPGQIRIRYSADGEQWQTGSFPSADPASAVSTGVDVSGNVYLLGARVPDGGLRFWNGVGAANWEAPPGTTTGTAPQPGGRPAIAYLSPGRWLVALRTDDGNLAMHVYDSSNNRWIGGDLAPPHELTSGLVSDVQAITRGNRVLVAWQHTSDLVTLTGTVAGDGTPSFPPDGVRPVGTGTQPGSLPPPRSGPFVTVGGSDRFLLGYVGAVAQPPVGGQLQQRPQVVVLTPGDGTTWETHLLVPTDETATSVHFRGIAGRSDGTVLVAKADGGSAPGIMKFSPEAQPQWSELPNPFDPAPSAQQAISLARTGRPAD